MKIQNIRSLSQQSKMLIRKQAVSCIINHSKSWNEVVEIFNIGRSSLGKWLKEYRENGEKALNIRNKVGRPAKTLTKLKPWQCANIVRIITDNTPDQLKFPFMLWNINAVKELIKMKFNINLSISTVSRYLKKWGFTPQRPLTKSFNKDPKRITKFLQEEYPLIKQKSKEEKADIFFLDEMGINNNTHSFIRGYGKKGDKSKQPILTKSAKRVSSNMISAINNSGNFRFMVYEENMNIELFLKFLRQLINSQNKKIFLILDNLRVHHAKKVKKWQEKHKDKIELFFLPPYSPELNPDELVNQDVKANALKHKLIHTKEELSKIVRSYLYSLQKNKQKLRNFFLKESVRYVGQ